MNKYLSVGKDMIKYQKNRGKQCIASGCTNKARVKGLCSCCYQKWKKDT